MSPERSVDRDCPVSATPLVRVQVRSTVKDAVCESLRRQQTAVLTVNLALTRTSGAARMSPERSVVRDWSRTQHIQDKHSLTAAPLVRAKVKITVKNVVCEESSVISYGVFDWEFGFHSHEWSCSNPDLHSLMSDPCDRFGSYVATRNGSALCVCIGGLICAGPDCQDCSSSSRSCYPVTCQTCACTGTIKDSTGTIEDFRGVNT